MWFHKHKLGKVQKDNFQYCETCGKAITAPNPCSNGHVFVRGLRYEIKTVYNVTQFVVTLTCSRCGEHKQYNEITGRYVN